MSCDYNNRLTITSFAIIVIYRVRPGLRTLICQLAARSHGIRLWTLRWCVRLLKFTGPLAVEWQPRLNCSLGPSRCFPFWQELLSCYVVNTTEEDVSGAKKCLPVMEDYYECLHHRKEVGSECFWDMLSMPALLGDDIR